jgi:hypothetical protein
LTPFNITGIKLNMNKLLRYQQYAEKRREESREIQETIGRIEDLLVIPH